MKRSNKDIENLYNSNLKLVRATIYRAFPNFNRFISLHGLEMDDLEQYGRIALWEAARDYNPKRGASFETFAINKIIWAINTESKKDSLYNTGNKTLELANNVSIDSRMSDSEDGETSLHEIIEDVHSPLDDTETKLMIEKIGEKISPQVKKVVKMRLEGYTYREIGSAIKVSPQTVINLISRNEDKLRELLLA